MIKYTAEDFKAKFGFEPQQDDLERVNCTKAGTWGHTQCGVCSVCDKPRFSCPGARNADGSFHTEHGK